MTLAAQHAGEPSSREDPPANHPGAPDRGLLTRSAPEVAQLLLGMLLVRVDAQGRRVLRIVETEAYAGPEDRASHARAGRTTRTSVMFGPPGRAYVYLVYGMHHCLNVVCAPEGQAAAVLIRAAEPVEGVELMRPARGQVGGSDARLAAGPGRLCRVLGIGRSLDGLDLLTDARLRLAVSPGARLRADEVIAAGPRVGIAYAGAGWAERAWRFGIAGHPSLSRPLPGRA